MEAAADGWGEAKSELVRRSIALGESCEELYTAFGEHGWVEEMQIGDWDL